MFKLYVKLIFISWIKFSFSSFTPYLHPYPTLRFPRHSIVIEFLPKRRVKPTNKGIALAIQPHPSVIRRLSFHETMAGSLLGSFFFVSRDPQIQVSYTTRTDPTIQRGRDRERERDRACALMEHIRGAGTPLRDDGVQIKCIASQRAVPGPDLQMTLRRTDRNVPEVFKGALPEGPAAPGGSLWHFSDLNALRDRINESLA